MSAFFCRHAQSTFNARGDNSLDVPLSEAGEAQARLLTGHFNLVLCSPMRRAQQTLQLSRITYDQLETVADLREHITEVCDLLPGESHDIIGESDAQLTARVKRVGERLRQELGKAGSPEFRLLVVAHLFTGQVLFEACGGSRSIDLANAKIVSLPVR